MAQRRKTEGAVSQRPNGSWMGMLETGRDGTGRRTRRTVYAKTQREVLGRLRVERERLAKGLASEPQRLTVGEYLNRWLDVVLPVEARVKPQTLRHYRWIADCYVLVHVGAMPLAPANVSAMLAALEDEGHSPNTRRLARTLLRSCLAHAEREGLVTRNAAALTRGPSIEIGRAHV